MFLDDSDKKGWDPLSCDHALLAAHLSIYEVGATTESKGYLFMTSQPVSGRDKPRRASRYSGGSFSASVVWQPLLKQFWRRDDRFLSRPPVSIFEQLQFKSFFILNLCDDTQNSWFWLNSLGERRINQIPLFMTYIQVHEKVVTFPPNVFSPPHTKYFSVSLFFPYDSP